MSSVRSVVLTAKLYFTTERTEDTERCRDFETLVEIMKIIGGKFKGRLLKSGGTATRPTQAIVRGAFFNICQNEIEGSLFLDCFAGSGAMGFEALSRGAKESWFIEQDKAALKAISENTILLSLQSVVHVIPLPAERAIKKLSTPFDLIYMDPPYDTDPIPFILQILTKNLLKPSGFLFLEERAKKAPEIAALQLLSTRSFGEAALHQYGFPP